MLKLHWLPNSTFLVAILRELEADHPHVPPDRLRAAAQRALLDDHQDQDLRPVPRTVDHRGFVAHLALSGFASNPIDILKAWATAVVREIVEYDPALLAHAEGKFRPQGCLRALALASTLRPSETFSRRINSYSLKHSAEQLPFKLARGLILPSDYVPEENFVAAMTHYGFDRRRNEDDSSYIFNVSAMHVRGVERRLRGRRPRAS